jgi:hypothetical protein
LWALLLTVLVSGAVAATVVYFPRPPGPDFNLTLSSNPVIVQANNWNSSLVKVESVRGFVGVVTFGIIGPSDLSTELSLGQLGNDKNQLVLGAAGNLTLYARSGAAADYSVRIVATGGPASHYVDLVVRVQDLAFTANTTSLTVARGSSGKVGISLNSLNRFSGNITLQSGVCHPQSFSCPVDTYVTLGLVPNDLILQPGGSATMILTVTVSTSDSTGVDRISVSANRNSWGFYLPAIQLTIV